MYIRTTNLGTSEAMKAAILSAQSRYYQLAEEASTQKKISKPSDDATAAVNILNTNTKLNQLSGYSDNMKLAQNELNVLDDSFASVTDSLQNANDLVTQAANGTCSQDELDNINIQIKQILANVIDQSNTQYNGNYIFSGTSTGTQTYTTDASGNISYQGDDFNRTVQISDGVTENVNVPGNKIFGSYTAEQAGPPIVPASGTGIIGSLKLLSDALAKGDTTTIRSSMDSLQKNIDDVSVQRTTFASVTQRFEMTQNSNDNMTVQLKSYRSSLQDADLTQVLTDLAAQKVALQATLSVTSSLQSKVSLLDYM